MRKTLLIVAALFIGTALIYDPWRFENTSGDTISARYWPVCILKHDTILLNPYKDDMKDVIYYAIYRGDDYLPRNGLGFALFTVPFYFVADQLNWLGEEWTHDRINLISRWNAIFYAALTVVLMFLFLVKVFPTDVALISSLLFAFGTWNLSHGAQGLSPQTLAVFIHVLSLHLFWMLCMSKERSVHLRASAGLGLLFGLLWTVRPQDSLLLAPLALVVLARRAIAIYIACALLLMIPVTVWNTELYGFPMGYYGVFRNLGVQNYQLNPLPGLLGLLVSPNRGLIIFFPLAFLAIWLWRRDKKGKLREHWKNLFTGTLSLLRPKTKEIIAQEHFYGILMIGVLIYFASICFVTFWHTTWSYGSRYMYDLQIFIWPILTFGILDLKKRLAGEKTLYSGWLHFFFVLFSLQCLFVHILGHRNYSLYVWNSKEGGSTAESRYWDYKDFMLVEVWNAGSNRDRWKDHLSRLKEYGY